MVKLHATVWLERIMKTKLNFRRNAFALEAMKLVATKVKSKKRYNRKKEKKVCNE